MTSSAGTPGFFEALRQGDLGTLAERQHEAERWCKLTEKPLQRCRLTGGLLRATPLSGGERFRAEVCTTLVCLLAVAVLARLVHRQEERLAP